MENDVFFVVASAICYVIVAIQGLIAGINKVGTMHAKIFVG